MPTMETSTSRDPVTIKELIDIIDALDRGRDFARLLLMACDNLNEDDASPMTRGIGEVLGQIAAARNVAYVTQQRLSPSDTEA